MNKASDIRRGGRNLPLGDISLIILAFTLLGPVFGFLLVMVPAMVLTGGLAVAAIPFLGSHFLYGAVAAFAVGIVAVWTFIRNGFVVAKTVRIVAALLGLVFGAALSLTGDRFDPKLFPLILIIILIHWLSAMACASVVSSLKRSVV